MRRENARSRPKTMRLSSERGDVLRHYHTIVGPKMIRPSRDYPHLTVRIVPLAIRCYAFDGNTWKKWYTSSASRTPTDVPHASQNTS